MNAIGVVLAAADLQTSNQDDDKVKAGSDADDGRSKLDNDDDDDDNEDSLRENERERVAEVSWQCVTADEPNSTARSHFERTTTKAKFEFRAFPPSVDQLQLVQIWRLLR